ncbi:hypothetical protein [Nostoc sp. 'Peltigera membranacea cyanobiont' N6]|uniref:hypothetical protein n=1 Tax=Nostoc sp. 'Peltigera membranacea cyanobiont' N6 TaxID=1261031 RepID=UPI000CF30398|nr:hypothetical protein [Nostoc sp. 'Peltigera membranacea cyanobiont' N6]AVH68445.1 hypothetical protein NPM_30033 [Nostoc sp. 'Peltigera membranacea cyanobiont' N6]
MLTSIWNRITDFFEKNWPILASGGGGIIVGMFILGQLVSGIKVSTKDGFEVIVDRTKLPTNLDIEGDWYNKTETNEEQTRFADDKCRIRAGTVRIDPKFGTYEVSLAGRRTVRADCGKTKPIIIGTAVPWNSYDAIVKQKDNQLSFWLSTDDVESKYGYVSARIISENGEKPDRIQGNMFYLSYGEDGKRTWFKTKIDFYRVGKPKAIELETIYPGLAK